MAECMTRIFLDQDNKPSAVINSFWWSNSYNRRCDFFYSLAILHEACRLFLERGRAKETEILLVARHFSFLCGNSFLEFACWGLAQALVAVQFLASAFAGDEPDQSSYFVEQELRSVGLPNDVACLISFLRAYMHSSHGLHAPYQCMHCENAYVVCHTRHIMSTHTYFPSKGRRIRLRFTHHSPLHSHLDST